MLRNIYKIVALVKTDKTASDKRVVEIGFCVVKLILPLVIEIDFPSDLGEL